MQPQKQAIGWKPKPIENILRGLMPVASVFTTAPTNLEKCTDGDYVSATGTGSKVMGALGFYGYLTFDLSAIKSVEICGRVGVWSTASNVQITIDSSDDNSTWRLGTVAQVNATTTSELVKEITGAIVTGRYIRVGFYVGAAATASCKIYEITGFERGL